MNNTSIPPLTAAVVMAIYNPNEKYFHEQLLSIFSQTYLVNELLIVDDCSTPKILVNKILSNLDKYIPKKTKIKIIDNKANIGHTKSFVSYLDRVSSDAIFYSDQDDVWFPEKISTCISYFAKYPNCLCLTHDFYQCDSELHKEHLTMMQALRNQKVSPAVVGHGFATAIRSQVSSLAALATDGRGGHDGWIRTFGEILGIRMVIDQPLAYWRRHSNAHGARNSGSAEGKADNVLQRISYRFRKEIYEQELMDYKDIIEWFDIHADSLNGYERARIELRLKKIGHDLTVRGSILNCSFDKIPGRLFYLNSKSKWGDYCSRILRFLEA